MYLGSARNLSILIGSFVPLFVVVLCVLESKALGHGLALSDQVTLEVDTVNRQILLPQILGSDFLDALSM